jgi:hypothetical protein
MGVMDVYETSVKLSKVRTCPRVASMVAATTDILVEISFASNYFYDVGIGFPKLSILAFYWTSFLHSNCMGSRMRKALYSVTAFVCLSYVAILWDDTFFCGKNVSVQWSQKKDACSVFYALEPFILNFTIDLTCYMASE